MTFIAIRLRSGDTIVLYSTEIEDVVTGTEDQVRPARIVLHPAGEDEPSAYRCPDLLCAALRAVSGQERLDPDPL